MQDFTRLFWKTKTEQIRIRAFIALKPTEIGLKELVGARVSLEKA